MTSRPRFYPAPALNRCEARCKSFVNFLCFFEHTFIKGIRSREAFDFVRFFLSEYSLDDVNRLFDDVSRYYRNPANFFVGPLYRGPGSNFRDISGRFDIKRPFLSEDEHRELLGWLEDFIYRYKADMFVEYSMLLLLDPFAATLFPQTELRRIYDLISGVTADIVTWNKTELKEKVPIRVRVAGRTRGGEHPQDGSGAHGA